jgi:hypothetical protein
MVSCFDEVASRTKSSKTSEKTVSSILTHINLPLEPAFSAYEDRQSPLMAHQVVVEKHTASSFNETTFNVDFASQSLPAPHESKAPRRNLVVDLKRKSFDVATKVLLAVVEYLVLSIFLLIFRFWINAKTAPH